MASDQVKTTFLSTFLKVLSVLSAVATLISFIRTYWLLGVHLAVFTILTWLAIWAYRRTVHRVAPGLVYGSEEPFLRGLNWDHVTQVSIIAHTGRSLYTAFDAFIRKERLSLPAASVRVLTRSASSETRDRSRQIGVTSDEVATRRGNGLNIEHRFYHTLPWLRGYLIECDNKERKALIGFYRWSQAWTSEAAPFYVPVEDSEEQRDPLLELCHSWFEHHWGETDLHTIVFDFDDTLFRTMSIQVEAWASAIEARLKSKRLSANDLEAESVRPVAHDPVEFRKVLRNVFVTYEAAKDIMSFLLPNLSQDERDKLDADRFEERVRLTESAQPFTGVLEAIERLKSNYHLAIVSATSEKMISDALDRKHIRKHFSVVLGKLSDAPEIEKVSSKACLLLKLSNLTGVSFDRMVFVGDNQSDHLAARQVGIPFVESRVAAIEAGLSSFVRYDPGEKPTFFSSYTDDSLKTRLEEILSSIKIKRLTEQ